MMDLIKPPTDNLYKFTAIFGLVLFVGGLVLPPWLFYQSSLELLKTVAGKDELAAHELFAQERKQQLERRKNQAETELKQLQARLSNLASSGSSRSREVDKLESAIKDANTRFETLEDAAYEFNLNVELKKAQFKEQRTLSTNETRNARLVMVFGWAVAGFGAFMVSRGFRRWQRRVQVFEDKILQMKAISKNATSTTRSEVDAAQTPVSQTKTSQTDTVQTEVPPSETTHTQADGATERQKI